MIAKLQADVAALLPGGAPPPVLSGPATFDRKALPFTCVVTVAGGGGRVVHVGVPMPSFLAPLIACGGLRGRPMRDSVVVRFDALSMDPAGGDPDLDMMRAVVKKLQTLRGTKLTEFNDHLSALPSAEIAIKKAVIRALKGMFVAPYRDGNFIYCFHGCHRDAVDAIFQSGLVALHRGDSGWYGKGVYTTTSPECAGRYASGELATIAAVPTLPPTRPSDPPGGCYPVIVCCAVVSMAYPVTRGPTDYPSGAAVSKFSAPKGQPSKGLQTGADTHVVPVGEADGFQAVATAAHADYWELVHDREELVVPMGVLWLKKV